MDIMKYPINQPRNHSIRNDRCISPPATAITPKSIRDKAVMEVDLISTSLNRLADAERVTQAKTARGPKGG